MVNIFREFWDWLFHRPVQLKEWGFYEARDGRVYGPLVVMGIRKHETGYYFKDEASGLTWSPDGKYLRNYRSRYDLVKELDFKLEDKPWKASVSYRVTESGAAST